MTAYGQVSLPFAPGESITYHVRVDKSAITGHATMSVEGPVDVRGTPTYLLRSQSKAGIGPFMGSQLMESWLDPVKLRSLRFHEHERRLFRSHDVRVEILPDERRWSDNGGRSGQSLTSASLDELSFIYYLRTLPLGKDTLYEFSSHFDESRDPILVHESAGGVIETSSGSFTTTLMEMRVHDPRRYPGEGIVRVFLSADTCRLPVRIESNIPGIGSMVLTMVSHTTPGARCEVDNGVIPTVVPTPSHAAGGY